MQLGTTPGPPQMMVLCGGVNSQLSRVKETLLYKSCKVFYPQMTLQPSLFVRWLAGSTEQREVNAATLRGETPKPGARRRRGR
jgi:hypothetical protein